MREGDFIEMVDMGDAEGEGSEEDGGEDFLGGRGGEGEEGEGDEKGAEEEFFC